MDTTLLIIKQQIQNWIRDKASPLADSTKVKAEDHANLLGNLVDYMDGLSQQIAASVSPPGVSWHIPPLAPTITANSVSETQSEVNNNGEIVVIPAQTITIPYAASGKKRKDAIVASYSADPPFYARVAGAEVDVLAIAPTPSLNPSDLFVRWVDVTDGVVSQITAGSSDAADIDYTPADTSWFGLATLKVKAALDAIVTAVKGKAEKGLTINERNSTNTPGLSYTITSTDAAGMVDMNFTSPNSIVVSSLSGGVQMIAGQAGTGQTTLVAGSGVTFQGYGNEYKLAGQFAGVTLIWKSSSVVRIMGRTTA